MDDKTWVGIFRQNTFSSRANLIDWGRVNPDGSVDTIDISNYKGDNKDKIFSSCWYDKSRNYFFGNHSGLAKKI